MLVKKQQLELCMEQLTGSGLRNEHIMRNPGLDELQAGIKIATRRISNHRCADDITQMGEGEEELKNLLMRVKEESEKAG